MSDSEKIRQALRTQAYDDALADRLGLNATDVRCLEAVIADPGITPSRLAEVAGLTSGAVTGVLDRLATAGFVERRRDPADRRSVGVHPVPAQAARVAELLDPLDRAIDRLMAEAGPSGRAVVARFVADARVAVDDETARLRAASRGGFVGDLFRAPLGGTTRGRLVFVSGAPRVAMSFSPLGPQANARIIMETSATRLELSAGAAPGELVTATFDGPRPELRAQDGVVTVRYPRKARSAFAGRKARLALSEVVPWSIELEGGLTDLTGSLDRLTVDRIDVGGGANHVALDLPEPRSVVLVRVGGVTSSVRLRRPAGVPVRLRVARGVAHLRFDGRRSEQVEGEQLFVSDAFADGVPRYDVEVLGGASEVRIATR